MTEECQIITTPTDSTSHPWHQTKIKPEPMEDHEDSGINSGSDYPNSSPESESRDFPNAVPESCNDSPIYPGMYKPFTQNPTFIPTPISDIEAMKTEKYHQTLSELPNKMVGNPLLSLQQIFENRGLSSVDQQNGNEEDDGEDGEDDNIHAPKYNSHGKIKRHRCKQCGYIAFTKIDFWQHTKSHIREDKLLTCPKCPFVTEYKHHLEYHLRNHNGSKPFKCDVCSYSCVNKSMLNSHKKSHSKIYQFRCADCSYASKYMHSLKLHLRKYNHQPAMVLNPDGTPNPLPIIDVYGTRRGPKTKSSMNKSEESPFGHGGFPQPSETMPPVFPFGAMVNPFQAAIFMHMHMNNRVPPIENSLDIHHKLNLPVTPPLDTNAAPEALDLRQTSPSNVRAALPFTNLLGIPLSTPWGLPLNHVLSPQAPQPKSQQRSSTPENVLPISPSSESSPVSTSHSFDYNTSPKKPTEEGIAGKTSRRKAHTTRRILVEEAAEMEEDPASYNESFNVEALNLSGDIKVKEEKTEVDSTEDSSNEPMEVAKSPAEENLKEDSDSETPSTNGLLSCKFCGIGFVDYILYSMHMGYHKYTDPFTCNMCGEVCENKITFNLHIAQKKH